MIVSSRLRWRISLALMVASGFAGLGYQIVWTQQASLWLGHESAAVLAVVAAFFGGLSLGAFALGDRIERSARPLRWYAACEGAIALWGLVLLHATPAVSAWALGAIGERPSAPWQWTVAFSSTALLLLPATVAMGATLPAIERAMSALQRSGRSIAAHYAANTFGAVLGVLAAAFWLVPEIGLLRTAMACVVLNLLCAGIAWWTLGDDEAAPVETMRLASHSSAGPTLARLTCTGLLGIGYEVVVVRVLGQVAEDTVYTFALLLAVYLVASALGAAAYAYRHSDDVEANGLGDRWLCGLAFACLAGTATLWFAEPLRAFAQASFGDGMAAALGAEAILALAAFALPAFAMGAVFSHLTRQANAEGASFGRALGFNTLGAALAPPLFGVLLAPSLGAKATLVLIALGYVALTTRATRFSLVAIAPAGVALAIGVLAPRLAFVDVPEGGRIVAYDEGATAAVSVVADDRGVLRLRIDNRQQEGSSATRFVDARQAMLPMLLHPAPRRALFLGLGTGVTAASAAEDREVQVDAVELLPEVIRASRHFALAPDDAASSPRLAVIAADARRFVRVSRARYDVIVADNFHPARSGSGALYTVEHFAAVRDRLAPDGLFCQWLPLHQLDLDTLRSIVRSFRAVYPDGWALLASNSLQTPVIGLVARVDGARFDVAALRHRLSHNAFVEPPRAFGIDDDLALLGTFIAGPRALAQFAGAAPLNTDDRPVVAYRAPRVTYAPDSRPADRLATLLHALSIDPSELVEPSVGADWTQRLAAYQSARDRFIDAGRNVAPAADAAAMLAQVRAPLLAVLRTSPEFRPAYDPLLRMASALGASDPDAARTLLDEMTRIQPARPEARALRDALAGATR